MKPYAVIETGGKQYLVRPDDRLTIERLAAEPGETIALAPVLAVSDGTTLKVGTPALPDATVSAQILAHGRAPKVISYRKKRRKGYHRKVGHRQAITTVRIVGIPTV
ncbi:MAG: 50S ribosomal protein L21 [Kiritimatiellae bacterium]|nr:50S ribosomal protein L21 [Kiritimatiellia bacterium]